MNEVERVPIAMITITDVASMDMPVTVAGHEAATTIRPWFDKCPEDFRAEIDAALYQLQTAVDRGEYSGAWATYLGIEIRPATVKL